MPKKKLLIIKDENEVDLSDLVVELDELIEETDDEEVREVLQSLVSNKKTEEEIEETESNKRPGERTWKPAEENPYDPVANWKKYNGYQKQINSNKGQINEALLEEHIQNVMYGGEYNWEEIPVDFSTLTRDRIRYTTLTPEGKYLFRTGGWIVFIDDKFRYLAYRAHTQTNWTLQASDCKRLFVIRYVKKEKSKLKVELVRTVYFKEPGAETMYNSYLPKGEEDIRVASFRSQYDLDKFEATSKFQKALESGDWEFK